VKTHNMNRGNYNQQECKYPPLYWVCQICTVENTDTLISYPHRVRDSCYICGSERDYTYDEYINSRDCNIVLRRMVDDSLRAYNKEQAYLNSTVPVISDDEP
jgi:hypothetical protein